jgi:ribokinase
MFKKIDFLAIGDITTDAFIRIKEASVHCDVNKENCQISMAFGEKIPFEFAEVVKAVGNSANAAVSAARLGLNTGLVSNIGNDQNGKECIDELKKNKVSTKHITKHRGVPTNYHYVLWYEDERTILIKQTEYPYKLGNIGTPKWIYLSSMASNSLPYHIELAKYLKKHPQIKLAFQPGTFQMKLGYEKLRELYEHTEVFFCNVGEAKRILEISEKDHVDIKELLERIHRIGPKVVCITDGPKGAYAYDGKEAWFMPPYPDPKPPYERTGAGDSFASTFTVALSLGKSLGEALMWGPINSMSVVQYVGAQKGLLSRKELEELLKNAPTDYKPRKI